MTTKIDCKGRIGIDSKVFFLFCEGCPWRTWTFDGKEAWSLVNKHDLGEGLF